MSREQYRARSKKVQKLGRDGLVEQDKATGWEDRISQRTADISFGPDRTPEQGLIQRAPAQGEKRRQRPRPTPPPEPAQPAAGDTPDAPEITPARRQANDVPAMATPPISDSRMANKRRQQKRASRLNPDAPSHFKAADDRDSGRLQFEPGQTPPADTASQDGTEPDAPRGADDVPVRERPTGRSAPPPIQRRAKSGGRLQFEPERTPPSAVSNTQTRQTERADASTPVESQTSVESQSHRDAPAQEPACAPANDPAAGQTRRQRKQYEKTERRVEQSGRRLEKAQAKLPTRRRARLEQEYDANTGKVRHRLRFETEIEPEVVNPSLPARAGLTVKTAAVMKLHGKLREAERDNTAVEAAHKGEFAAERGAGRFLRWNKQRLRSKPYRAVRQAEHRLHTDQTRLAWQTALRDNPDLRRKNTLARWFQRQQIKRKYAQAAREAQKTAQHTQKAVTITGKIIRAVQQYVAAHKSALLIVAMLALVIALFSSGLASCTAMLSGVQTSYLSATYLSDEQDICNADLYFTELETDLQLDIASTEADYPRYDEYRYNIGDISHNPYELMSYLSAVYGVFTFEQVQPELDRLFGEKYQLIRIPITETRYDDEGNPYEWRVLQSTLTVRRLGDIISASLTPGEQTDLYSVYMQTYGSRQAFSNPFDFPWLGYVSSGYGWRVHPISGEKNLHRGVDIAAAQGTAIKAIHDGRVVSAGDAGSYGLCVVIEDDKGYQSRYAHCSSLSVSAGQEVKRGDVIGAVGSTGNSTGPHLHLEVMLNGEYLNPYYFVDTGGSGESTGSTIPSYSGEPVSDDRFAAMLEEAEKYLSYPYVWGGASPTTSFDCSGYVSWVINHSGWNYGRLTVIGLENVSTPVSAADAKPGDLVFFIGTYDAPYPDRPTHVGIYVGNGMMIHCGNPISYANLNSPYWVEHFYGFGRLPEP